MTPQHQALVGEPVGDHRQPVGAHQLQCLGQVVLALGVIGRQARQRLAQRPGAQHVDTAVDLADLELGLAGVARSLGLDDPLQRPVGGAHYASVPRGVRELDGRDGRSGARGLVRGDQRRDRIGPDQRHVAAEHDHRRVVVEVPALGHACARRPPGAVGDRLDRDTNLPPGEMRERLLGRIDEDDPLGAGVAGGCDDPLDHRPATDLVQDLRPGRDHARAAPGRKDQHRRRTHASMVFTPAAAARLGGRDSNPDSQDQNLMSCHWTTPQGRSPRG